MPSDNEESYWHGGEDRRHEKGDPPYRLLDQIARSLHGVNAHLRTIISIQEQLLTSTIEIQGETMADLSALSSAVENEGSVVQSAITLLNGLADQVRQLSTDPAALQALADSISQQSSQLADAVAANTPAAPAPPDTPPTDTGGTTPPDSGGTTPPDTGGTTDTGGTVPTDPTV